MKKAAIKQHVKEGYAKIAQKGTSCCPGSGCCGTSDAKTISKTVGYTDKELNAVPEGANLGLGCGNPVALASLKKGEMVLDLGSGAGFDAFLAAKSVGNTGQVIGVDMTPDMIKRAKENAKKGNYTNVDFRLGEIEKLPVNTESIDIIISNCVINLSPDKQAVFNEAFRVLKPGGRLMVSDLVLLKDLPAAIKESIEAYIGCLAGASMKDMYIEFIKKAGFKNIKILSQDIYPIEAMANDATIQAIIEKAQLKGIDIKNLESSVASIKVYAVKKESKK